MSGMPVLYCTPSPTGNDYGFQHVHPKNRYKIAVIGLGDIGMRIAAEFVRRGCSVCVFDADLTRLDLAPKVMKSLLASFGCAAEMDWMLQERFHVAQSLEEIVSKGFYVMIEAIVEDQASKQELFQRFAVLLTQYGVPEDKVLLMSNSMSLPIERTSLNVPPPYKSRCIGMRFLYPVMLIDVVDVKYVSMRYKETCAFTKALLAELKLKRFARSWFRGGSRLSMRAIHRAWTRAGLGGGLEAGVRLGAFEGLLSAKL